MLQSYKHWVILASCAHSLSEPIKGTCIISKKSWYRRFRCWMVRHFSFSYNSKSKTGNCWWYLTLNVLSLFQSCCDTACVFLFFRCPFPLSCSRFHVLILCISIIIIIRYLLCLSCRRFQFDHHARWYAIHARWYAIHERSPPNVRHLVPWGE